MRTRLCAAWRAFKDPSLLEHKPERIVEVAVAPKGRPWLAPETGTQHKVVRHFAGTDEVLYPRIPGQDHSREARDVFDASEPHRVGEFVTWYDGTWVRGQKVGG